MSRPRMDFEEAKNRAMKMAQDAADDYRFAIDVATLDIWLADSTTRPTVWLTRCERTGLVLDCAVAFHKEEDK